MSHGGGKTMVYKIAVVDDEAEVLKALTEMLDKYKEEAPIDGATKFEYVAQVYSDGEKFLSDSPANFDIVFLDINMPGLNGLQVAQRIRRCNRSAAIIFITHYAQYAVKGYEVNAVGFLVKPIDYTSFKRNLDKTLEVLSHSQSQKYSIKTKNGIQLLTVGDIVYVEVQLHSIIYRSLSGNKIVEHYSHGTMRGVYADLCDHDFCRCGAAYIVNLRHITAVRNKEIHLHGDVVLPISRKFSKAFSDAFMRYIGSTVINND